MRNFKLLASQRDVAATLSLFLLPFGAFVSFGSNSSSSSEIDFEKQIAPILADNCLKCHNGKKARAGLDLSTRESTLKGSEAGEVLVPGKPEESLLVQRATDGSMPPEADGRRLTEEEVRSLAEWVKAGALWPETLILKVSVAKKKMDPLPTENYSPQRRRLRIGRIRNHFGSWRDLPAAEQSRSRRAAEAWIDGSARPAAVEPVGKWPVAAAAGKAERDQGENGNDSNVFHDEAPAFSG